MLFDLMTVKVDTENNYRFDVCYEKERGVFK